MYSPENKLEFDTSGRCLLYLYRPRVIIYLNYNHIYINKY